SVLNLLRVYMLVVGRGASIALQARDPFARVLGGGRSLTLLLSVLLHAAIVAGLVQLAALPSPRGALVAGAIVLQQHRTQRLFGRPVEHLGAARRVVLAVVGAAVDQVVALAGRLRVGHRALAKADEAQLPGGVDQLVRADGAEGHHAA